MDSQNSQPPVSDPDATRSAEALRELHDRAQAAIAARRDHFSRLEADITTRLEGIAASLAEQEASEGTSADQPDETRAEIARLATKLEDAQAASQLERAAWESEREALEQQRATAEADRTSFQAERLAWETERSTFASHEAAWATERAALDADRAAWESERSAWQAERNELIAKATGLEADRQSSHVEQQTSQDELRGQLTSLEQKLNDQRAASVQEQAAWKKEQSDLQRERDELQQKFELALEDVQRFRSRVAELEQDLARRPKTDKADSAELVALRAERDGLAERIKELEQERVTPLDADAEQQRADLQRRFELAVEDVRDLKTKNAKLEAKLASAGPRSSGAGGGGAADSGAMDWESQKQRLLASLEGGDGADDSISEKDRASIESTIEITDAVVADKDAVIADLKAQLAAGVVDKSTSAEAEREQAVSAMLNSDEVITQYRKKAAQLEQDLEGKLRAAELELSVERAKIARNRAELDSLRVELESQRHAQGTVSEQHTVGTPKRRWLSKLGLSGDDET